MMPVLAILSTIETVALRAALAPSTSFSSSLARIALSAVRNVDRIPRLCSRRLTFCRFALRADLVRLATVIESFELVVPPLTTGLAREARQGRKETNRWGSAANSRAETVG